VCSLVRGLIGGLSPPPLCLEGKELEFDLL